MTVPAEALVSAVFQDRALFPSVKDIVWAANKLLGCPIPNENLNKSSRQRVIRKIWSSLQASPVLLPSNPSELCQSTRPLRHGEHAAPGLWPSVRSSPSPTMEPVRTVPNNPSSQTSEPASMASRHAWTGAEDRGGRGKQYDVAVEALEENVQDRGSRRRRQPGGQVPHLRSTRTSRLHGRSERELHTSLQPAEARWGSTVVGLRGRVRPGRRNRAKWRPEVSFGVVRCHLAPRGARPHALLLLVVGAGPPHPGLGQASRPPAASGRRHCGKYSYSAVPEIREDRLGQIPDACCEAREEGARCAPGRPARDLRARSGGGIRSAQSLHFKRNVLPGVTPMHRETKRLIQEQCLVQRSVWRERRSAGSSRT